MTRVEFIAALRAKLSMLSADEREDAIQFYQEYFDEAGPENEQAVIDELGSPDAVAEKSSRARGKLYSADGRAARMIRRLPGKVLPGKIRLVRCFFGC